MTRKNFEIPALYSKNFEISSMDFLVGNFNKNNVLIYNLGMYIVCIFFYKPTLSWLWPHIISDQSFHANLFYKISAKTILSKISKR